MNPKRSEHSTRATDRQANAEELIDPEVEWGGYAPMPASHLVGIHNEKSLDLFDSLIEAGVCREQARGVLPQNLYTEYYGTVNLSNLLKFIDLRTHEGAQWEIQKVAEACLEIATDLFPVTVGAYRRIRNEE
jgi:thymidylate synthase ThyX